MNHTDAYARTIIKASEELNAQQFDTFFDNFIELLKSKNHYMLVPLILKKIELLSEVHKTGNQTVLVVSDIKHADTYKQALDAYNMFTGEVAIKEDPNIVGGYIVKNKTTMVDNSYRTRLLKMYRSLVS